MVCNCKDKRQIKLCHIKERIWFRCNFYNEIFTESDNYHNKNSHVYTSRFNRFHCHKLENKNSIQNVGDSSNQLKMNSFRIVDDDLAEACIFLLKKLSKSIDAPLNKYGEPLEWLNVGTGFDITIKDLAQKISCFYLTLFKGDILWNTNKPDGTFQNY